MRLVLGDGMTRLVLPKRERCATFPARSCSTSLRARHPAPPCCAANRAASRGTSGDRIARAAFALHSARVRTHATALAHDRASQSACARCAQVRRQRPNCPTRTQNERSLQMHAVLNAKEGVGRVSVHPKRGSSISVQYHPNVGDFLCNPIQIRSLFLCRSHLDKRVILVQAEAVAPDEMAPEGGRGAPMQHERALARRIPHRTRAAKPPLLLRLCLLFLSLLLLLPAI